MPYKEKISKSILRPYYHKVLEYKAIRGIALKVLKESDFFEKTGLSPDKISISFGDDGTFPKWETPVFVDGVCVFRLRVQVSISSVDVLQTRSSISLVIT